MVMQDVGSHCCLEVTPAPPCRFPELQELMLHDGAVLCRAVVLLQACDCLYGVLLVAGRVVAVERGAAAPSLNVFDLLLLINFSSSNESLRCAGHQHSTTQVSNLQPFPAAAQPCPGLCSNTANSCAAAGSP